jgi:hypothetical protein
MDFVELKRKIEIATRQVISDMFEKHGKDEICAFALCSDGGAWTVVPSTNTKKHIDKQRAANEVDDLLYYKYETAEWEYECEGESADELFDEICELCRNEVPLPPWELDSEIAKRDFENFQNQLFETCIEVLEKLKSENFFKQIVGKDILLLFTASDHDFSKKEYREIVTRLNDGEILNDCLDWIKRWSE